MRYLSIKNFEKFQQYRDRRPPWIKLHASILDDYDIVTLPDTSKCHLILLWVLASQVENKIPYDLAWITQRIGARSPVDLEELILRGFIEPYDEIRARGRLENWSTRYVSAQTRSGLLSAAQNKCTACGATSALEIDHIIPISKGGTSDLGNLQVLCRQCNRRKRANLSASCGAQGWAAAEPLTQTRRSTETETETETDKETKKEKLAKPKSLTDDEQSVLEYYLTIHPLRKRDERSAKRYIGVALKTFSVEDLKKAIDGNATDPWHREKRKHELSYVFRNIEKISAFIEHGREDEIELDEHGDPTYESMLRMVK